MTDSTDGARGAGTGPLLGVEPAFGTAAGVEVRIRVAVRNTAPGPRSVTVTPVGIDPSWVDGPVSTPVLEAGATTVVEIVVTPPGGTVPAHYPFAIAAQELDPATGRPTSGATGTAETTVTVNPRTQLTVDLSPRVLTMVGSRRFAVELRNGGASPARVRLMLQASPMTVMKLSRTDVRVGAGQTVTVRGRARVRKPQMMGGKMRHPFTVTARGTESVRHVDGQVVQRSVVGPGLLKVVALLCVLAVWVGAAVVFIPSLAEKVQSSSEETAAAGAPDAEADGDGDAAGEAGGGSETDGAGEDGGSKGDDAEDADAEGLQLSGTVAGESPDGVTVRLEPTSLVDEEAQRGVGVGVPASSLGQTGMRLASAFVSTPAERRTPERSVQTADDGSWAFPAVRTPGYYLATFTKPGFQTQRFVIDSSNEAAAEPLEVDLAPGEGSLSGRITDRSGRAVGGAAITITDGTSTITTNSNSQGDVGSWSIDGLSTPSTYVVTASKHAMSSESRVVPLAAGGTGTASLELVPGVATLTGKVQSPTSAGKPRGVGGLTVSVSDGKGDIRTTTTLTESPRGRYSLPSLPAPGTYSITVSGAGYQARTTSLTLARGQALAEQDFLLRSASGSLVGQILTLDDASAARVRAASTTAARRAATRRATRVGLENAGLTLENAEHTYKTTSTAATGAYEITGIAPGTYVLTTQYFGTVTDHVSVEIEPGETQTLNRTMAAQDGAGLPASATIKGSVIDASTGLPIATCPDAAEASCLTAHVEDPAVLKNGQEVDFAEWSIDFEPGEQYQLPDPETAAGKGLRPGLHTVDVTAPGFEVGTVDVEVAQGAAVEAPLVELYPAPVVTGTISAAQAVSTDATRTPSCVWVLKGSSASTAGLDCRTAMATGGECALTDTPYDGTTADATRWCAKTDGTGAYRVQVPAAGTYSVYVQAVSEEYVASTPETLRLTRGATESVSKTLDRLGRVRLTVTAPGSDDDDLVLANDVEVTVSSTQKPVVADIPPTGDDDLGYDDGVTIVAGLRDRQTYAFTATYDVPGDAGGDSLGTVTGTVQASASPNTIVDETLRLTSPVPWYQGQVLTNLDNARTPLEAAAVRITAPFAYNGDAVTYGDEISLATDDAGCFAVQSKTPPTRLGGCTDSDHPDDFWPGASFKQRDLVSNRATVTVSVPGYDATARVTRFSTVGTTTFTLDPLPIEFGATAGIDPTTGPAPDWSKAEVEVVPTADEVGDVTATIVASAPGSKTGRLTWHDDAFDAAVYQPADGTTPAGKKHDQVKSLTQPVLPGTYAVTATLPGYETATATLSCRPAAATGCTWSGSGLTFTKLGEIAVTVVDPDGNPVEGAFVEKLGPRAGSDTTQSSGRVVFSGITPDTDSTEHSFTVTVTGFAAGTTGDGSGDVTLDCTGTHQGSSTAITIPAGGTVECDLRLERPLATVVGTLKGALYPADATSPHPTDFEHLTGRRVELIRCSNPTCTQLSTTERWTQTTSLAVTGPDGVTTSDGGTYAFAATDDVNGVQAGRYLLYVLDLPTGFERPANAAHGTVIDVPAIRPDADGDLHPEVVAHTFVFPQKIDFGVKVTDQHQHPVTDATVTLSRSDLPAGAPAPVVDGADAASGIYRFHDQWPGTWQVTVSASGIPTTTRSVKLQSRSIDQGAVKPVTVTRAGGAVSGLVTSDGTPAVPLAGASVTLTCATPRTTPARYCGDPGEPAIGTDGEPLTTTAGAVHAVVGPDAVSHDVNYSFASVPSGTYDVLVTARGYLDGSRSLTVGVDAVLDAGLALQGVRRNVTVVITTSHQSMPATFASGTTVELVATGDTPAFPTPQKPTLTPSGTTGRYTVSFSQVRWGCYRLVLDLPDDHLGTVTGPTGSPADPGFGCSDPANLVVPDDSSSTLEVGYAIDEGRLDYTLPTTTWPGHDAPATTLTITGADGWVREIQPDDDEGSVWVPDGAYTVGLSVPDGDAAFWSIGTDDVVDVPGTGDDSASVSLDENTFAVTLTVPSVPDGEQATIVVGKGPQQGGTPPAELMTGLTTKTVVVELPRGHWSFTGTWSGGPGFGSVDVQGPVTTPVQLGPAGPPPAPDTTPTP